MDWKEIEVLVDALITQRILDYNAALIEEGAIVRSAPAGIALPIANGAMSSDEISLDC